MKLPVKYIDIPIYERRVVREAYIKQQNGLCAYCGASLSGLPTAKVMKHKINKRLFPPNFFKWPVHLHHDHKTGMTKGAVHCFCNAVMWEYHGE